VPLLDFTLLDMTWAFMPNFVASGVPIIWFDKTLQLQGVPYYIHFDPISPLKAEINLPGLL
jgi:hypothetical protein